MGESIWAMDKVPHKQEIVYATTSGSIGKVSLIDQQEFDKLSELQKILIRKKEG